MPNHLKMPDPHMVPFPNSYWVIPGKFLAGEYPGANNDQELQIKLNALLDCGIRCVINLMEENEVGWNGDVFIPYEAKLKEIVKNRGIQIFWNRLSVKDFDIPSTTLMKRILNKISQAILQKQPVYIHCLGGIGRTGTVVGCYLMQHKMASHETVLDEIQIRRRTIPLAHRPSPETKPQRDMILNWKKD